MANQRSDRGGNTKWMPKSELEEEVETVYVLEW
jgi:hypothetical protein